MLTGSLATALLKKKLFRWELDHKFGFTPFYGIYMYMLLGKHWMSCIGCFVKRAKLSMQIFLSPQIANFLGLPVRNWQIGNFYGYSTQIHKFLWCCSPMIVHKFLQWDEDETSLSKDVSLFSHFRAKTAKIWPKAC